MNSESHGPDPGRERGQLLWLAVGFLFLAVLFSLRSGGSVYPAVFVGLALVALLGAAAYPLLGRDVFLAFSLLASLVGRIISWLVLVVLYAVGIACFGAVLGLFGMNRLDRRFDRCRDLPTMFREAPGSDAPSFRRKS